MFSWMRNDITNSLVDTKEAKERFNGFDKLGTLINEQRPTFLKLEKLDETKVKLELALITNDLV
jgi:hypothetical protein